MHLSREGNRIIMKESLKMKFEWAENQNTINKEKHKISFEIAAYVFDDSYYIEMYDP